MKKNLIVVFVFTTFLYSCESESFVEEEEEEFVERVFDGNVRLLTQEEVNTFGAEEYTIINGNLIIGDRFIEDIDIFDLTPLRSIRRLNSGTLKISGCNLLTSLNGLHNVESIHNFRLEYCNSIENLTDLESLTEIGNELGVSIYVWVLHNDSLQSLRGLEALGRTRDLAIGGNPLLHDFDGLNNVIELGSFIFGWNDSLENIDALSNLMLVEYLQTYIGCESATVLCKIGNTSLTNFCGLQNLFVSGVYDPDNIDIRFNEFNPSIEEIIIGDCSF